MINWHMETPQAIAAAPKATVIHDGHTTGIEEAYRDDFIRKEILKK